MDLPRPTRLLGQNRELRDIGVYNWTLPAWAGRLPDGRTYNTCPSAGVCRHVCYALNGTYRFPAVRRAHLANLLYVIDDLAGWQLQMTEELAHIRHLHGWVRVHDAGDFFSDDYTRAWLQIMRATPLTRFYAYTKEVTRFRALVEPDPPANFRWVYSLGGRQDRQLTIGTDRTADVFPDTESIWQAGWTDQSESDLLAVTDPSNLIGIPANHIPQFLNRQRNRSLGAWQAEVDARREHRAGRR
ncbi:GP88 family protein [Micromonospora sp. WMMC273]|uniref:GP88 family protein n=1 Tax=Micromonospora sp. WMMC273 TaxID=3015157 RepID=UPI0022B5EB25|nr:hypothetical protein [Micromonospora sp. WMMC273]MCZ7478922.1 hypothetical protein [Micromonospora sp. WMMC273]